MQTALLWVNHTYKYKKLIYYTSLFWEFEIITVCADIGLQAERITSMKNSSDTTKNQSRKLPACTAVPQPTAPVSKNLT